MAHRYLVFGASGFIATHLIRRLVAEGHGVIAADVLPPRERQANVDYRVADVRNLENFDGAEGVDCIYNFAAVHTTPGHEPFEYYDTNISGAVEITRLAERFDVNEIVFTSSISVYGPSEETKTEESVPEPVSDYGRSKFLAEKIHRRWLEQNSSRKLTVVRPAVVFGPGERGNFTRLAKLLKKGVFIYPGREDTIKACMYVEDLLDAIAFARLRPEHYILFNGAYPNRFTLEQIVGTLIRDHFPSARPFLVPRVVVTAGARVLGTFGFLNIGIHPERVLKLIRSTDIYPGWLKSNGFDFPPSLESVMMRWKAETNGTFE